MTARAGGDVVAAVGRCVTVLDAQIFPTALLSWSVGGMFFGLLLQALWEERPLSEGLD